MKKIFIVSVVMVCTTALSQTATDSIAKSRFLKPADLPPLNIDFSYYAKNYEKVFGEYNFTNDSNNFGTRNVYVGYGDRLYYQNNSTFIMEMPNNVHNLNFSGGQDVLGGLKNLTSLFSSEKDYSVKQK